MYEFFCASLPELSPGTPPPLSVEEFDLRAEAELSPRHFAVLKCDALHPAPAGAPAAANALNAPINAVILLVFAFPNNSIPIGKTIGVKIAPPIP